MDRPCFRMRFGYLLAVVAEPASKSAVSQESDAMDGRSVMRDVSVIVTAYNDSRSLSFVLAGLKRQSVLPAEVVIADDGSTPPMSGADPLLKLLPDLPFDVIHVWQPDKGFRAARSRNNAIHQARGARLAFLDQDTIPHRNWLETHMAYLRPRRVCLARILLLDAGQSSLVDAGVVASGEFERWHQPAEYAKLRRQQRRYMFYTLMRWLKLPIKRTRPSLSSGNISAMKDDLRSVNGFDEEYVGWGQEDDDLGRRLYMAGVMPIPVLDRALASHVFHEQRHPEWKKGANRERYRIAPASPICGVGLDSHPYPDVVVARLKT